MGNFFAGSWVPQIGGLLSTVGLALTAGGQPFYGTILTQVGAAVTGLSARQNNKSSEAVGIKAPEVVIKVEPPIVKVMDQSTPQDRSKSK